MAGGTGDLNIFFERVNMLMYLKSGLENILWVTAIKQKKYKSFGMVDEWMKLYKIDVIKTNTVRDM